MIEPTSEQCSANERIELPDGSVGFATWYPQIGGYVGKCIVVPGGGGCFDAYVWHDGEFPFEGGNPAELHHCDPEQFIRFGETVRRLSSR